MRTLAEAGFNYEGLTREEEISHPLSCLRQFALQRNMTSQDVHDLISAGIGAMYQEGRFLPTPTLE